MARASIIASDLARILTNANAFVPAKTEFPYVRLRIGNNRVAVLTCDNYTIVSDHVECSTTDSDELYLTSEGSKDLESLARSARKLHASLESDADGLTVTVGNQTNQIQLVTPDSASEAACGRIMFAADELMAVVEKRPADLVFCAFMPSLIGRFGKVKPASGDQIIDLKPTGVNDVVFVKVGATFRGAIRPILRSRAPEGTLFDD